MEEDEIQTFFNQEALYLHSVDWHVTDKIKMGGVQCRLDLIEIEENKGS